jgi:hypothetical protein
VRRNSACLDASATSTDRTKTAVTNATAVSARIATVDFSLAGDVACGLVLVFGIPMLFFAMLLMVT